MTDPLGENSRNPAKEQEKSVVKPNQNNNNNNNNNNKQNMLGRYKRWRKHNEIQLTKKMHLHIENDESSALPQSVNFFSI